jgi:hypothetical protein
MPAVPIFSQPPSKVIPNPLKIVFTEKESPVVEPKAVATRKDGGEEDAEEEEEVFLYDEGNDENYDYEDDYF